MGEAEREPMERPRKGENIMGGGVIDDKGKTQKLTRLLRPVSVGMFYLVGQFVAPKHRFFSFLL